MVPSALTMMLALGDCTSTVPISLVEPSRANRLAGTVIDSTSITGCDSASSRRKPRIFSPENQPMDNDFISALPSICLLICDSAMPRAIPSDRIPGSSATRTSRAARQITTIHSHRLRPLRLLAGSSAFEVSESFPDLSSLIGRPPKKEMHFLPPSSHPLNMLRHHPRPVKHGIDAPRTNSPHRPVHIRGDLVTCTRLL